MHISGRPLNLMQLQQNIIAYLRKTQMHIEIAGPKQQDCR